MSAARTWYSSPLCYGRDTSLPLLRNRRYTLTLGLLLCVFWGALAIRPADRATWLLENVLFFVFVPTLVVTYRWLMLSRLSYTLIFIFLCLHAIGAHYTYSAVPYDRWFADLTGSSLNQMMGWERNHYDRMVHFLFGALLGYPAREIFVRVAGARGFWGYFLPLVLMMACSMVYELIEWWAAVTFGGDLGVHYLGTQGDEWDGQRDMALASLGALLAMIIAAGVNLALQRDFALEWQESLRVKRREPLGEVAIVRMWRDWRAARRAAADRGRG